MFGKFPVCEWNEIVLHLLVLGSLFLISITCVRHAFATSKLTPSAIINSLYLSQKIGTSTNLPTSIVSANSQVSWQQLHHIVVRFGPFCTSRCF